MNSSRRLVFVCTALVFLSCKIGLVEKSSLASSDSRLKEDALRFMRHELSALNGSLDQILRVPKTDNPIFDCKAYGVSEGHIYALSHFLLVADFGIAEIVSFDEIIALKNLLPVAGSVCIDEANDKLLAFAEKQNPKRPSFLNGSKKTLLISKIEILTSVVGKIGSSPLVVGLLK